MILFFSSIELKRVFMVEKEILNESKLFFPLSKEKQKLTKNSNRIDIENLFERNPIDLNNLYQQWKKIICKNHSYHHQEKLDDEIVISKHDLDSLISQPIDEIEYNEESYRQLSPIEQIEAISDKHNDSLTTENEPLLTENKKNSRTSLFKLDKNTSTHSLTFIPQKSNLGKHENWISNAMLSYKHPFHDFPHKPCYNTKD